MAINSLKIQVSSHYPPALFKDSSAGHCLEQIQTPKFYTENFRFPRPTFFRIISFSTAPNRLYRLFRAVKQTFGDLSCFP